MCDKFIIQSVSCKLNTCWHLTHHQSSSYNFVKHATQDEMGAQDEMAREKARDSPLSPITPHFPTLHHATCSVRTTVDKSVLEWLNFFNKFSGHMTLGFITHYHCRIYLSIAVQNN